MISGCSVKKLSDIKDNEKFAQEYDVSKNNPFKYAKIDEVLDILESGSGIIYFATADCEWCRNNSKILVEQLQKTDISTVYYYNPTKIKNNNTKKYQRLVKLLNKYLEKDETGKKSLLLPDLYVIKNGQVVAHNNDVAKKVITAKEYLSKNEQKKIKNKYLDLLDDYKV